jgi:FecR protein
MNRSALTLALISAAFAGNAEASAGRIDFSTGGVVATRPNGQQRPLLKGAELESGDTIRTNDGRAQIRFSDGAYVSLQPNTVFGVNEYKYDGKPDGSERGFFSLLKGAMRAVTGLIGRVNRNTFQITTPTATVGIRGTGGLIAVLPDGSTLIRGSSGIWSLSNAAGSIDVPAGSSGLAPADPSQPPKEANGIPQVPPAPPPTFVSGDERTDSGDPIVPTIQPLQSGSGYAAATAFDVTGYGAPGALAATPVDAVFNTSGQLTEVTMGPEDHYILQSGGSNADFGTDGILAWGRWIGSVGGTFGYDGPYTFNETYNANQGLHYVIGMPTPAMPTTGSAIFTLLGATSPTYIDGHSLPGTFLGSLEVYFGARTTVGMNFNITMPDGSWDFAGTASGTGALFSGTASSSSGFCSGGCTVNVQGFAYDAAGVSTSDIVGAAAFTNTGVPVPAK